MSITLRHELEICKPIEKGGDSVDNCNYSKRANTNLNDNINS